MALINDIPRTHGSQVITGLREGQERTDLFHIE